MKLSLSATLAVAAVSTFAGAQLTHADIIAQWTFETSLPAGTASGVFGSFAPEVAITPAVSAVSKASAYHAGNSTYSNPTGNGSSHSFSSTVWVVNDYYQFVTDTTNYTGLTLSFDQTGSKTGPKTFKVLYTTDSTTYNELNGGTSYSVLLNDTASGGQWSSGSSAISAYTSTFSIPDGTVGIRLVDTSTTAINGAAVATGGTDRVDNVIISGNLVPEPASLGLIALGALGLLSRRRK